MSSVNTPSPDVDCPRLSDASFNRCLGILVGGSLLAFATAVVLRLGIDATTRWGLTIR